VKRATEVIRRHGLEDRAAIRLDSGDLIALARQARQLLDSVGLDAVRILVSGGLDEHDVERFVAEDAPIDAVGLGTRVVVSADAPYLDTVYKLVDYGGRPVLKLSAGKATQPGRKQVVRSAGLLDTVVLREWSEQSSGEPLLVSMMEGGRRVRQRDELAHARNLFEADLAALPEETRRLVDPRPPPVSSSAELRRLEEVARSAAAERTG
jgi:nicotinate phosphoribosyltransferase